VENRFSCVVEDPELGRLRVVRSHADWDGVWSRPRGAVRLSDTTQHPRWWMPACRRPRSQISSPKASLWPRLVSMPGCRSSRVTHLPHSHRSHSLPIASPPVSPGRRLLGKGMRGFKETRRMIEGRWTSALNSMTLLCPEGVLTRGRFLESDATHA
jgi:hypothetical protein